MIYPARLFVRKRMGGLHAKKTGEYKTVMLMVVAGELESLTDEALHDCTILETEGALTISIDAAEVTGEFRGLKADQVLVSHAFSMPLEKIREGEERIRSMAQEG